jgi:hypothetical protein
MSSRAILFFPNPAENLVHVSVETTKEIYFTIHSLTGLELKRGIVLNNEIHLSDFKRQIVLIKTSVR